MLVWGAMVRMYGHRGIFVDGLHLHVSNIFCAALCADGQLRLAGGNIENEGRVEICKSNKWGTVCDDSWGSADAAVVCHQLGYSSEGR